jgi:hypothetical protein
MIMYDDDDDNDDDVWWYMMMYDADVYEMYMMMVYDFDDDQRI